MTTGMITSVVLCVAAAALIFLYMAAVQLRWIPRYCLFALIATALLTAGWILNSQSSSKLLEMVSHMTWSWTSGPVVFALAVTALFGAHKFNALWPHPDCENNQSLKEVLRGTRLAHQKKTH